MSCTRSLLAPGDWRKPLEHLLQDRAQPSRVSQVWKTGQAPTLLPLLQRLERCSCSSKPAARDLAQGSSACSCCSGIHAGECRLQLAIGKTAGAVSAWRSPAFADISGLQGTGSCGERCAARAGSSTVVGLTWAMPPVPQQQAHPVLTAAGQDGSVSSWRWEGLEVSSSTGSAPQGLGVPCGGHSMSESCRAVSCSLNCS